MNKVIAIALLLTLASAAYPKKAGNHYADTKSIFAEMDKDHFGNSLISAI